MIDTCQILKYNAPVPSPILHIFREEQEVSLMISRERYLQQIRPFYDSDLIKVITGIRRCGKSILLKQVMDELKALQKEK